MFDFDLKKLKQNSKFLISTIIVIIVVVIFSIFSSHSLQLKEKELADSGEVDIHKLVINEIMSSNGGTIADSNGKIYDWIELYNGKKTDVNLKNYGLSDEKNQVKWVFPDVTIKANSYLIIYLSGTNEDGLHASFKLKSSGGETVALKSASGKIVDAIETVALNKDEVMARDLDGNFIRSNKPTPGYINTNEGFLAYQKSLTGDSAIKVNEVLPRNKGNFKNEDGIYSGYIEIINTGDDTVNLEDYCISNSDRSPFKFHLPSINLKKNEVYLIYTSSYSSELSYSDFKLDSENGVAILTDNKGKVIDKVTYENLANGLALIRGNDKLYQSSNISPGYSNNTDGVNAFVGKHLKNNNTLIINEVMNSNSSYLGQNGNSYYDWIELKNNSSSDILLSDYYLSTNDSIEEYKLPEVTIKPGEYYVIIASGDTNLSNNSYKHANFKIGDIESLYILKDKKIVDSIFIADVPLNYSIGRNNSNGFYYMGKPSPLKENNGGVLEVSYNPTSTIDAGIYNDTDTLNVELSANGTIYYTLDGNIPTTSSNVYNGPIFIDKTTVLKAISYEDNKIKSDVITKSYIVNEKHTLPVMSVSLNPSSFNQVQTYAFNTDLEVSAYAELYEDGKSFTIPCGFKLFGGSTRSLNKKSFLLKFRKEYGAGKLNYQVFDNRDFSSFNSLILRSGSQDSEHAFFRDILATSLMEDGTDVDVQAYKSVILYINGKYWGVYNIREKMEAEFVSNHYNVDSSKANIMRIDNDVTSGSSKGYTDLMNYIESHNLAIDSNYEYVKTKINMTSLIDFWIAEDYVTNNDIINTRFFSHPDVDNGRWNFIFYDLDFAWYNYQLNYFNFSVNPEGMSDFKVSTFLLRNLMKNKKFKQEYLERLSYNMKNTWNKEKVLKRIDEIYNKLLPEMERNQIRWGSTLKDWQTEVEKIRIYVEKRESYLISQAKSFFGLSKSDVEKYFGD